MSIGITVMAWSKHSIAVAAVTSACLVYCVAMVTKVITELQHAYNKALNAHSGPP